MLKVKRLGNGVKVVVKERRDLFSATVSVWVRAGAAYEKESERGIAHFLEHILFNGSENFPEGEADRIIEGAGGELNAATSYDYTYYYVNLPAHYWETALTVLSDLTLKPLIDKRHVEKEIPIVLEEIARSRDNPHEVFTEEFLRRLYRRAPYRFPILGFEETVRSFTPEKVRSFYERFYTPERLTVVVEGNIRSEKVLERVEELFGRLKRKESGFTPERERELSSKGEFVVKHPAVELPYVLLGWKLPPAGRHDVYYDILDSLLSLGRSSLFFRELREKGITFSASSNYQNLKFGANFTVAAVTEKPEETVEAILKLCRELPQIGREEFEVAKRKLYRVELFGREEGEAEADSLGFAVTVMDDIGYSTEFLKDLKEASLSNFCRAVEFLKEEPLVGFLLPETAL